VVVVGELRGLVLACARTGDELGHIAGPGCPYTLPIAGRSLLSHALRCLIAAEVGELLVVVGASIADEVVAAAGNPGIPLRFAVLLDEECDSSGLDAARDELGAGPVLVHLADSLLPEGLADVAAGEHRVFARRDRVVAFSLPDIADAIGEDVAELETAWKYDGTVDGILDANHLALDQIKRGRIGADLSSAEVQGRVQIHPTAVLNGAKIRGPVYIGPEAVVQETYVGPYTSISGRVELEGVEIENSIVLPGAAIRFPGRRLEASLVGEDAQIGRDFSLPSALRLRVGRGADIQLS
jgi:NDP-sugar pyrophosphorylase family protein